MHVLCLRLMPCNNALRLHLIDPTASTSASIADLVSPATPSQSTTYISSASYIAFLTPPPPLAPVPLWPPLPLPLLLDNKKYPN